MIKDNPKYIKISNQIFNTATLLYKKAEAPIIILQVKILRKTNKRVLKSFLTENDFKMPFILLSPNKMLNQQLIKNETFKRNKTINDK